MKYYKKSPENSLFRKIYDYYILSFQEYLDKYYKNANLKRWKYLLNKFVHPPFDKSKRGAYMDYLFQVKPHFSPDFDKWDAFWENIKNDNRFDEELKKFFTFLHASGFYKDVSFEDWLHINNWNHPWYKNEDEELKTVNEILSYVHGLDYLKILLADMPWLTIR
ncbi:MAG: hypothetical protein AAF960_20085 [Bacteroidota bacterium]